MAKLEELEEALGKSKVVELVDNEFEEDPDGGEELLATQDVIEAISLLSKCMHFLDYLSDTDLCKSVTKREREGMGRLSEIVRTYLDEVSDHYEDSEEEEVEDELSIKA